jgi:thioredoxin
MNLKFIKYFPIMTLFAVLAFNSGCSKDNISKSKDSSSPEHLTTASFKEKVFNYEVNKEWKYEGDLPSIVDFYADWCAPCKKVAPILEEISKEYDGQIKIYKVDVDKETELASAFGIQSIPTLLFIPKEGQPQMTMGAMPKDGFVKAINEVLLKD